MKNLNQLIEILDTVKIVNNQSKQISSIEYDSRKCCEGSLFVAIRGNNVDGHRFIQSAIKQGAKAIVCESLSPDIGCYTDCTFIKVKDSRKALAKLAHKWYDYPTKKINVVGVTGTNGKTTITYLLKSIFQECGFRCGLIGTTGIFIDDEFIPATHTTPESLELAAIFDRMSNEKVEYVFMEVSSHSLAQSRVYEIAFDSAIFTNLTHDHLDYHKDINNYAEAKKILFDSLTEDSIALINSDDTYSDYIVQNCISKRIYTIGRNINSDILIIGEQLSLNESSFYLDNKIDGLKSQKIQFQIQLAGRFNVTNAAMAATFGIIKYLDINKVSKGLYRSTGAPGRMEKIRLKNGAVAIVDYAHTPDALENALLCCREILSDINSSSKLICVFGCGGDRDRTKRPIMGNLASRIADYTFITSDNPRTEDADKIINEIYAGIGKEVKSKVACISNRSEAIKAACQLSRPRDIILIAGKGHEKYQIIGVERIPFDDVGEVEKYT